MARKVLIHKIAEPLHESRTASFDIHAGTGNLMIDQLSSGDELLASGELEYMEKQDPPAWTVDVRDGKATFTLKGGGGRQPGFRLPWASCNGATSWQIHLNPAVLSDITACSGGGNVRINLVGMAITSVSADSGGGNMDVALPDQAVNLRATVRTGGGNVNVAIGNNITGINSVIATSGAGNVVIHIPGKIAARIHATSGLGKAIVDPRFSQIDDHTYQSPGYETAGNRVEITLSSGAGNVIANTE